MTNEMIIYLKSAELVENGILEVDPATGMPEVIHTFAMWKRLGYSVKKGEKAIAEFYVWKNVKIKEKEIGSKSLTTVDLVEEEKNINKVLMRRAFFFKRSQVEPLKK